MDTEEFNRLCETEPGPEELAHLDERAMDTRAAMLAVEVTADDLREIFEEMLGSERPAFLEEVAGYALTKFYDAAMKWRLMHPHSEAHRTDTDGCPDPDTMREILRGNPDKIPHTLYLKMRWRAAWETVADGFPRCPERKIFVELVHAVFGLMGANRVKGKTLSKKAKALAAAARRKKYPRRSKADWREESVKAWASQDGEQMPIYLPGIYEPRKRWTRIERRSRRVRHHREKYPDDQPLFSPVITDADEETLRRAMGWNK
ncbi:MAG: hypothetical protein KGI79_03225 [Patescibacteria group bacterium]|nr:hypothetical protein [Patescibacteria group bacterium]